MVVGGGLVGASLADELACRGATVVLVDRRDPGRATDAGAGILSPETNQRSDATWLDFAQAARRHYDSLVARLEARGAKETGFCVSGLLSVVPTQNQEPWFERLLELATERHPGVVREVDPAEAVERFPPLARPWRALFNPVAGRVDGAVLEAAILSDAEGRGVRRVDANVVGLEVTGSRVQAVTTAAGRLACDAVAIAGGAWSPELEGALAVTIPIVPLKGQIVHLVLPGVVSDDWPIVQPLLSFYLVPWPGGRIACGGTMEADAGFDVRPTAAGLRDLLREGLTTAPGLAGATFGQVRVGLRPAVADDWPVLGRVPGWDNAYVAAGHGAEGLLLGPYSGALVAAQMAGEVDAGPELNACSLARFLP